MTWQIRPVQEFGSQNSPEVQFVTCHLKASQKLRNRPSESPFFFPGWFCHFKRLFKSVWCEIHSSKIPSVTSWQLTNWRVMLLAWRNLLIFDATPDTAYVNHFSHVNLQYDSNQFRQNKSTRDFVVRSVDARLHWCPLRSHFLNECRLGRF